MSLLYHAYVYLEFLIFACTIYILAPCFLPGNAVAYLNINLLAASLSNKVDSLLIELADINII